VFVLRPADQGDPGLGARERAESPGAAQTTPPVPAKIKFRCGCGAGLTVPGSLAGRGARCAKCGSIVNVPAENKRGDLDDVDSLVASLMKGDPVSPAAAAATPPSAKPTRRVSDRPGIAPPVETPSRVPKAVAGKPKVCPCCKQSWPANAIICTDCGINLKTGRALMTTQDENLDQIYAYTEGILRWLSWIVWSGLYPMASEAFGLRKPWVVRGIAIITILVSVWFMIAYIYTDSSDPGLKNLMLWSGDVDLRTALKDEGISEDMIDSVAEMGLDLEAGEYHPHQLVTHAFLHAGPIHLAGNLLFLMVLGSRVNALIGNILTVILYPLLAIAAGVAHMAASAGGMQHPMLGASGAVMGLAGMYLVLFPTPKVHTIGWVRPWPLGLSLWFMPPLLIALMRLRMRVFVARGFWVVLFYIAFDVVFTVFGLEDEVAHWAHLGGFLAGAGIALVLIFSRLVNARGGDLISAVLGRHAWQLLGKPNRRTLTLW
jgi:membrane associated rhomboid family serine protease